MNNSAKCKHAIARTFAAIINADGIVSIKELEYLNNEIKPKYKLTDSDFEQARELTFAEAVKTIKKNLHSFSYMDFVDDIGFLARVDGNVHAKEALLWLSLRHAVDDSNNYLKLQIISNSNNLFSFPPNEIIYVENETDDYINQEIKQNYDIICYMLQSFGFEFIYIPKIKEIFQEYDIEYQKEIMQYLYPYIDTADLHQSFVRRLNNATITDFTNILLKGESVKPSMMMKIASTKGRNGDEFTDFILLDVKGNGFMTTLQRFLSKFDSLCGKYMVQVQRGKPSLEFNWGSFHRTFVTYINNAVSEVEIHLYRLNKPFVRFGNVGGFYISHKALTLYLTLLYCSHQGKPFTKDWGNKSQLERQYELFYVIYKLVRDDDFEQKLKGTDMENEAKMLEMTDFYGYIQVDYNKLKVCFGKLPNKYLLQFAPTYDRITQIFDFPVLLPVKIIKYKRGVKVGHEEYLESFINASCTKNNHKIS